MMLQATVARLIPFVLSFLSGSFVVSYVSLKAEEKTLTTQKDSLTDVYSGEKHHPAGSGTASCDGKTQHEFETSAIKASDVSKSTEPLRIVFKERASYTDLARANQVHGTVNLRVTFLASGRIGSISVVKGLPYGLTESAVEASRRIKFEPKYVKGVPQSTRRLVSFTFNIY